MTGPARAELGVREAYSAANAPQPSKILWAEDPGLGAAVAAILPGARVDWTARAL